MRKSGIGIIGDVPWGTHFCHFYSGAEDLIDILVPYFASGLEANEYCMWVTAATLTCDRAAAALRTAVPDFDRRVRDGQIEILPHTRWYLEDGHFDLGRVLDGWVARHDAARRRGFEGLRLTGDTVWLEKADWAGFTDYEAEVNRVIGNYRMMALCTYSLDRCGATEVLDVVKNHQFALVRRDGDWQILESSEMKHAREVIRETSEVLRLSNERLAKLQEQTRLLDAFFEHSFTPLAILDRQFTFVRVNRAYAKANQKDTAYFPGKNHFALYPHEENQGIFEGVVRTRIPYQAVAKAFSYPEHPEWGVTYWDWTLTPILDADGEVEYLVFTLEDVTEPHRMQEELRRASAYGRSLIEASLDPLVTISTEGKITDVNRATETATGVSRDQLIGNDFSDYFTDPEQARQVYRKVLADGLVRDYPLTIRGAGTPMDVLYNATVYSDSAGLVQGVFAAARDVTEHNRLEAELTRYREHLEELVETRTRELADANLRLQDEVRERRLAAEALRRAVDELARSNSDLEQFAYAASHDLQEPLRMVGGFVQLLQKKYEGKLDAEASEFIHYAVDGSNRMQTLINDLLTYSRVGTRQAPMVVLDSKVAFDQALENLREVIRTAGATVTSDPLPSVSFIESQMVQLFQNLIGNAVKFRREEPPRIHVSAAREGEGWLFSVRDNGIGIEPQYAERIFLIFQRLHSHEKFPGTGIGLAICKRIVNRHGGRIWVESQPGKGSTFLFSIPD